MWVIAFMILLTQVILTLQYPYYNQTSSLVSFLSVQVVFILPLLAQVMLSNQPNNALEQAIGLVLKWLLCGAQDLINRVNDLVNVHTT